MSFDKVTHPINAVRLIQILSATFITLVAVTRVALAALPAVPAHEIPLPAFDLPKISGQVIQHPGSATPIGLSANYDLGFLVLALLYLFIGDAIKSWSKGSAARGPLAFLSGMFIIGYVIVLWIYLLSKNIFTGWVQEYNTQGGIPLPFLILTVVFGVSLYAYRTHAQSRYGVIEVLIAILAIGSSIPDFVRDGKADKFLQLAGGLYILVRGLDNIGQGLPEGSVWQRIWRVLFPKPA